MSPEADNFAEYRRLILSELERLNKSMEALSKELHSISVRISTQEVKSGLWGALAGSVPALAAVLYMLLSRHK